MSIDEPDDWPFEHTEKRMALPAVAPKTEPELLDAIVHGDHAARVVYADWLEEQGDRERAEFVRLQDLLLVLPSGAERQAAINRATAIAITLDHAWRVIVARIAIRNCTRDGSPSEWGSLGPTHTSDVRICGTCHTNVEYRFASWTDGHLPIVVDGHYGLRDIANVRMMLRDP